MFIAANAASIGEVRKVSTWATVKHWGDFTGTDPTKVPLFARDDVFQHDAITTPKSGAAWIIFNDDTELFVSRSSEIVLSKFVYDGENEDGAILRITKGVFRFISGKLPSKSIKITTPIAVIGIRGTDIEVSYLQSTMTMTVTNWEGNFEITMHGDDQIMRVRSYDGCKTIEVIHGHLRANIRPCNRGGPSIGRGSFGFGSSGGGGRASSIGSVGSSSVGSAGSPDAGPDQGGHQNQSGKGHGKGRGKGHDND